jgi:putative hydrolase of the HAD superfamily
VSPIDLIAFDADDTLWHSEYLYKQAEERLGEILAPYGVDGRAGEELFATEMRNLSYYGFGFKSFALSMIETAIRLSGGRVQSWEIQQMIELAKQMIDTPVQVLDGVPEAVAALAASHRLMVITKGDLLDQERKLDRSGLAPHFAHVEIVSDKNEGVYRQLLARYRVAPQRFLMVGNSLRSDILPVVALGGHAVHIPYHTTWAHETVDWPEELPQGYVELAYIGRLPGLVAQFLEDV